MPKAHALLAGSGVGTPAVRTFLDLDSTADGGALLHTLWRAHRVQGVGLAAGASTARSTCGSRRGEGGAVRYSKGRFRRRRAIEDKA